jgi:sugar O-acyltransferase (sialic acid O-acetyltransferase NeuD family)
MSKNRMFLYGAGGHSNVVTETLRDNGIEVAGIFDDDATRASQDQFGIKLLGNNFPALDHPMIIAIGDNANRAEIASLLPIEYGIGTHPSAIISDSANVGEGTVILHGAIIQSNSIIGKHVLINTAASVDHDNVIGDFAHISPQVALCGHVKIGEGTHVGAAATVIPSVTIGKWCTIGAGAVVINDIPDYCTAVGNPARIIKQRTPPPTESEIETDEFDLVFVGSGLSSTMTLINLLKELTNVSGSAPVKIGIIDEADTFFVGVPYGDRAGKTSLIITNLEEFLPAPEIDEFKTWLSTNKEWALKTLAETGGEQTTLWLDENAAAIEANSWDKLYLPRYLFGLYLAQMAKQALDEAQSKKLVDCKFINALVNDISRTDFGFDIQAKNNSQASRFSSRKIVLAIGSPPFNSVFDKTAYSHQLGGHFIDAPYRPGLTRRLEKASDHLTKHQFNEANILIVGSNASTMEAIYSICDYKLLRDRINKIYVLSTSGTLPNRLEAPIATNDFEPASLVSLRSTKALTAERIWNAAIVDTNQAQSDGIPFRIYFDSITRETNQLIQTLNHEEKLIFVERYGVELGRRQRRAGAEYVNAVDQLRSAGKIEVLKGRYAGIGNHDSSGFDIDYIDENNAKLRSEFKIQIAINCTGFERLSESSTSPLIRKLLARKLCAANRSGHGFRLDDDLSASDGLHVIGPLMGGNVIGGYMLWHAEHCGRIIQFAKPLGRLLADELRASNLANFKNSSNSVESK